MSSMTRTIRRSIMFKGVKSKYQRWQIWQAYQRNKNAQEKLKKDNATQRNAEKE